MSRDGTFLSLLSVHKMETFKDGKAWGCLNCWVVSHSALIIGTLCHALGCELKPWWQQTLFRTQAQHLHFLHDSIWFIWFDTIMSNLSCELWNRKLKIKEIYFLKRWKGLPLLPLSAQLPNALIRIIFNLFGSLKIISKLYATNWLKRI